jgi:hypothetical protein
MLETFQKRFLITYYDNETKVPTFVWFLNNEDLWKFLLHNKVDIIEIIKLHHYDCLNKDYEMTCAEIYCSK